MGTDDDDDDEAAADDDDDDEKCAGYVRKHVFPKSRAIEGK